MRDTYVTERRVQTTNAALQALVEAYGLRSVSPGMVHVPASNGPSSNYRTTVCSHTPPQVWQVQRIKWCARGPTNGVEDGIRQRFCRHRDRVHPLRLVVQTEQR